MKNNVNIGVVCLARTTFDHLEAQKIYASIRENLQAIENTNFSFVENLVIEVSEAKEAAQFLSQKNLDGIIVISGTFHLGHLVLEIDKVINKPILLWGLNELPYNGGKIRLNSVCGVNLNASNLYKSGNRQVHYIISDNIDKDWLDAIRALSALKNSHIGIAGFRAHGFFNLGIDELNTYKEMGVLLDHYELSDIFNQEASPNEVISYENKIKDTFQTSGITQTQVTKVAELCVKLKHFFHKHSLNGLAIRCWPEFASTFGISPCAAMSILQSEGIILGCEGDVEGVISMIVHRAVGAETPFLADLSQVDIQQNFALMWHCGVAPCNLWDSCCERSLDTYFAGGKGVTADFVMKSGELNILRLDSANGKYRLFMQKGQGLPMEKLLKGTYVKVKFESHIKELLDKVVYSGVAHHVSLAYGNFENSFRILAKLKGWEIIE
jgi:L-fucose isomerase-like protein